MPDVSSRTPEGYPIECPICGNVVCVSFADVFNDAVCPQCGCLLLGSETLAGTPMRSTKMREHLAAALNVSADKLSDDASYIAELGVSSLETVELIMELQEESGITIPDDEAEQIQTVGELFDYLEDLIRRRRNEE